MPSLRRRLWPIGAGLAAYAAYIVWIGGDFMGGRFLTAPFVVATLVLVRLGLSAASHLGMGLFGLLRAACPCAGCRGGHENMRSEPDALVFDQRLDNSPATRISNRNHAARVCPASG